MLKEVEEIHTKGDTEGLAKKVSLTAFVDEVAEIGDSLTKPTALRFSAATLEGILANRV